MSYHIAWLDNNQFFYSSDTKFYVQVGKGDKGSYKTKYSFTGDFRQAVRYYQGINIGNGYKKRLMMDGKKAALARQFS